MSGPAAGTRGRPAGRGCGWCAHPPAVGPARAFVLGPHQGGGRRAGHQGCGPGGGGAARVPARWTGTPRAGRCWEGRPSSGRWAGTPSSRWCGAGPGDLRERRPGGVSLPGVGGSAGAWPWLKRRRGPRRPGPGDARLAVFGHRSCSEQVPRRHIERERSIDPLRL